MPELPDIVVYIEALEQRILNQTLERALIASPFLLRTAVPPISNVEGQKVIQLRRLGKRICIGFENDLWLVLHLMIAGRLHWKDRRPIGGAAARSSGRASAMARNNLAVFQFTNGSLSLTEAGSQRRASLHLVAGEAGLQHLNPGGLEIFESDLEGFAKVLTSANHTLKRALTDPRLFSGIGNAYSDEILFDARLSPVKLTQKLTAEEIERLFNSTRATLTKWTELLRASVGSPTVSQRGSSPTVREGSAAGSATVSKRARSSSPAMSQWGSSPTVREGSLSTGATLRKTSQHITARGRKRVLPVSTGSGSDRVKDSPLPFPEKVTAFRPDMCVHGKYGQPCPRCGHKIQRIRYASNETNYCPSCQTGGKPLADRALSRLLRADWPKSVEELEEIHSNLKIFER